MEPARYLVDTNVISAVAPTKKKQPPLELVRWLDLQSDRLFLSVVTVAELSDGAAKLRREGATRKAGQLEDWLGLILHLYADRVLPLNIKVARTIGQFSDLARGRGQAPGFADLAIAATTFTHELVLLTRNVRHFEFLPVSVVDPFTTLP
ncbi:type II toxin-antitoxin system VapC family toxin [Geminicoccus roseus]|uniref:type II toxin-antitoxin system VapC family toxin n=1 Tax=Geminicoccus roseus TaxID=404900 RepID=UPI00040CEBE6|nr:type II toxin-antitoxin system VapC family toxin [Geminicoccus roseus]